MTVPGELLECFGTTEVIQLPQQVVVGDIAYRFGIVALHHELDGLDVDIRFDGERFEMEDQCNWSCTELNRCRSDTEHGNYITHGNTAIVHAAARDLLWLDNSTALHSDTITLTPYATAFLTFPRHDI